MFTLSPRRDFTAGILSGVSRTHANGSSRGGVVEADTCDVYAPGRGVSPFWTAFVFQRAGDRYNCWKTPQPRARE
jgi:hypothetical protein